MNFVALGALYCGDSPEHFEQALFSLSLQTRMVDICLVVDGPITIQHESVISKFSEILTHVVRCPVNKGLSYALNKACKQLTNSYDYIIRFDSDDINQSNRFEITCNFIEVHKPDLLSLSVIEFDDNSYEKTRYCISETPSLLNFRFRNPVFHPASAVRLQTLSELGYYEHVPAFEDWATWIKFANSKKSIMLSQDVGVMFRVSDEMVMRRFGWGYFRKEIGFSRYRLKNNYFSLAVEIIFLLQRAVRNLLGFRLFKSCFVSRS